MRLVAYAFASAALISVAHRPWLFSGYLAFVALAPLLTVLAREKNWARGALAGAIVSLGTGLVAFEGVAPAEFWAYPILVLVACVPWAAAGALLAVVNARLGTVVMLWFFPAFVVAAEFVPAQRMLLGGFANGMSALGYTQFGTPVISAAAWSSVSGVTLLLAFVNVGVYCLLKGRYAPAIAAVSLTVAATFLPAAGTRALGAPNETLEVAVVQGAVRSVDSLFARFDREAAQRMLEPYADLTEQAGDRGVDLVVWGETVIPHAVRPGVVPDYVAEALAPVPVALVGGVSFTGGNSYNSIFHWQDGALTEVYRKRALVPLNESHYTAGTALPPLALNGLAIGMGVCLDSLHPEFARESVRAGATLLVYVTEDSFAGFTVTPELHLRVTAFRAAETARQVVFANQSGPSAIFDERGRVLNRLQHGAVAAALQTVKPTTGITPFVLLGDWVGWLAVLAVIGASVRAIR